MLCVLLHLIPIMAPGDKNYWGVTQGNGGINRVRDTCGSPLCEGQSGVWPFPGHCALPPYTVKEAESRKRADFQ